MTASRELYLELVKEEQSKEEDWYFFDSPCDYSPIIHSLGEVLVKVHAGNYTGDTFVLLTKGTQYGILILGWGSCSGCDALQGCESFEEIDDLILRIQTQVKWFDSKDEVINHVYTNTEDWSYYEEEWAQFQEEVKGALNE